MFEFSQLRCFVAVAAELHFSRAAWCAEVTGGPGRPIVAFGGPTQKG